MVGNHKSDWSEQMHHSIFAKGNPHHCLVDGELGFLHSVTTAPSLTDIHRDAIVDGLLVQGAVIALVLQRRACKNVRHLEHLWGPHLPLCSLTIYLLYSPAPSDNAALRYGTMSERSEVLTNSFHSIDSLKQEP